MSLQFDEAELLKAYNLDSLEPSQWHTTEAEADAKGAASSMGVADEPDPLGLRSSMATFRGLPKDVKTQTSLSSKAFDAKVFLSTVHPDATFADLSHGILHLKNSIDQRSEALKLREPRRSVDEQERTIEILLELDPTDDPVSIYLEAQHQHLRSVMRNTFDAGVSRIEATRAAQRPSSSVAERDRARDLQKSMRLTGQLDASFDKCTGADEWRAIRDLVKALSDTMLGGLPSFWRVAKNHAEGKFIKTKARAGAGAGGDKVSAQNKAWAVEALEAYISLVSHLFSLTDVSILMRQPLPPVAAWVPAGTSSATAAHFLRETLAHIVDACNDLAALGIASATTLRALLTNARFCFVQVVCVLWQEDAKIFHLLEDWTLNPDEQATTLHLRAIAAFHKSNARQAFHLAGGRSASTPVSALEARGKNRAAEQPVASEFTTRIKGAFLDALYAFLDGMVQLAFSEYSPLEPRTALSVQAVPGQPGSSVDVRDLDTRVLLSVTNLAHLTRSVIPGLVKQFSDAYAALLSLVEVHAHVRSIAKPLVTRTITTLVDDLTATTLDAFQRIASFGMGGMLQATLEIEFLHQTLAAYISPQAEQRLKDVYETISHNYVRTSRDKDTLNAELERVKQILVHTRKEGIGDDGGDLFIPLGHEALHEHTHALEDTEQNTAHDARPNSGLGTRSDSQAASGHEACDDGVPGILLLTDALDGAVERGEHAAPHAEVASEHGCARLDRRERAWKTLTARAVAGTLDAVPDGATHCTHGKRTAKVVQDDPWTWVARVVGVRHAV
ncbi:hypothetical protein L1887_58423 [Cichorium endivia]|nr:hypothetical protein L1887_58423 [Cichorium endivia]